MEEHVPMNPVSCHRQGLGLSRREFAQLLGVAYDRIAAIERGHARQIPATWATPLANAGVADFAALRAAYAEWRKSVAMSLAK